MIPSIAVSLLKLGLAGPLAHPIEKKKVAAAELPHVTMKCSDRLIPSQPKFRRCKASGIVSGGQELAIRLVYG